MFQTEPILFLQGIHSDVFYYLMLSVNLIGPPIAGLLLSLIIMTFDRRKGAALLGLIIVTAIAHELIRDLVALPRPIFVDSNILFLDQDKLNETPLVNMGAKSFFGTLPQSAVDYHRENFDRHFGFPSGHVSSTLVLWGGLAMLYRRTALLITAGLLVPAVAVARMYLGKHFIADVLGGALLGGVVLATAYLLWLRPAATKTENLDL